MISGGCGFIGRNMVKRLYATTNDKLVFIDNLSVGLHPSLWLTAPLKRNINNIEIYGEDERLIFLEADFQDVMKFLIEDHQWFKNNYNLEIDSWHDVFHFAAIVGGRTTIENDPITVALDLAIDAIFFNWVTKVKPARVLYPSSSAAYPIHLQTKDKAIQLKESDINFHHLGQPDMTYGWAKLTGEYLAKITASKYRVHITCIRPFSGYGEDQDNTYPIPAIVQRVVNKENPIEVWGDGHQGRDFIHIDDVIDCTLKAMDHISDGSAINIGSGQLTSFREIIQILTDIAGYEAQIKCLEDKPVGVHSRYSDQGYAENLLGWKAVIGLVEGLKKVYESKLKLKTSDE